MEIFSQKTDYYDKYYYQGRNSNYIFWYSNLRFSLFWRRRLKILNQLATCGKLLDVGCAFGFFLKLLQKRFEAYGIDMSEYAIRQARNILSRPEIVTAFNVEKGLPFEVKFDVITAFDVMEHIYEPLPVLITLKNALKKDGHLYMELPIRNTLVDREKMHYYKSLETWIALLHKAGLTMCQIYTYYTIGLRMILIPRKKGNINYCAIVAKKS